ncbi:MAG TPA: glycosyltransferase family 9 protein, partial [Actinomycetota bacterium]
MAVTPRLLVLRALGLGDLLAAVPAMRALARACRQHERVLAAPAWLSPLLPLIRGRLALPAPAGRGRR